MRGGGVAEEGLWSILCEKEGEKLVSQERKERQVVNCKCRGRRDLAIGGGNWFV